MKNTRRFYEVTNKLTKETFVTTFTKSRWYKCRDKYSVKRVLISEDTPWVFPVTTTMVGMWDDGQEGLSDANFETRDLTGRIVASGGVTGYPTETLLAMDSQVYESQAEWDLYTQH